MNYVSSYEIIALKEYNISYHYLFYIMIQYIKIKDK